MDKINGRAIFIVLVSVAAFFATSCVWAASGTRLSAKPSEPRPKGRAALPEIPPSSPPPFPAHPHLTSPIEGEESLWRTDVTLSIETAASLRIVS